jgi:hypothetical protein
LEFSEGQDLQMRWQPFRSRKLFVREERATDQLASTGAESDQRTTTRGELRVEIHPSQYKSGALAGQIADVARDA